MPDKINKPYTGASLIATMTGSPAGHLADCHLFVTDGKEVWPLNAIAFDLGGILPVAVLGPGLEDNYEAIVKKAQEAITELCSSEAEPGPTETITG